MHGSEGPSPILSTRLEQWPSVHESSIRLTAARSQRQILRVGGPTASLGPAIRLRCGFNHPTTMLSVLGPLGAEADFAAIEG